MSFPNIAAVVVHMQNSFLKEIDPLGGQRMYENLMKTIKVFADKDLPICTIELVQSLGRLSYGVTVPKIVDVAEKSSNYVNIRAEKANAFEYGNATEILLELGVEKLLMMGVYGSFCVTRNAEGAKETGKFEIIGSRDLMIDPVYARKDFPWFIENNTLIDYKEILKNLN